MGTCGQLWKTIQYKTFANGFGCTTLRQYGNRCRLRTHGSLDALCLCGHDSCKPCCVALYTMCECLCGERHQEDPPVDDVALFRGEHVRKGSGICCCIHDTLMSMYLYMPDVYIYYTWELLIFLDIKVCGCNSACMCIQYGDCELV